MRLVQLGLVRYGRFTGRTLDFGERPASGPDLHIVYGRNEAGKSTTLAAWLDLLYGIGMQSPYGFLHPYATMRIEATLELEGRTRRFARIKRPQNSLLDAAEQPLADAAILSELGGIGRDAYRTMFSLDDDTLVAGGESILANRGDLGQLLFSASAGLAALGQRLERLKQEADSFYKPSARKTGLAELKARLAALKEQREAIDMLASTHAKFVEAERMARESYAAATAERGRLQAESDALKRQIGALPRLASLRTAREELRRYADLAAPPAGWASELPALQAAEVALATRREGLRQETARLERALAALTDDPAALAEADRLAGLDDLKARHSTAARDLPVRMLELAEAERTVAGILARIGRPDAVEPRALLIDAARSARLMALVEARSGIAATRSAAETESKAAEAALAEAEARFRAQAGSAPLAKESLALITATLASLRSDDLEGRAQRAHRALAAAEETLAERLSALAPWQGHADALAVLIVPAAADIADWKSALAGAAAEETQYRADLDRLTTQMAREEAAIAALDGLAGIGSEAEAAAARLGREAAWALHRSQLDRASADAFEAAMRRDDVAGNARLIHVTDGARRAQIAETLAVTRAERLRAEQLLAAASERLALQRAEIAARMERIVPGLMAGSGISGFETWLQRRALALEAQGAVRIVRADAQQSGQALEAAKDRLAAVLVGAGLIPGDGGDLDELRSLGDAAVAAAGAAASSAEALAEGRRALERRHNALDEAVARDADWHASWQAALEGCWLAAAAPPVTAMREILTALQTLSSEIGKTASLADRIGKMENDQAAYRAGLDAVAAALDIRDTIDTATLAGRLRDRVAAARAADTERRALSDRLAATAEAETELVADEAVFRRQSSAMTGFFGVETLADVATSLAAVADRTRLLAQAAEAERDIIAALDVGGIAEGEAMLAAADRGALTASLAEQQRRLADCDARCEQLFAEMSAASDRLAGMGGDGAVAALEVQRRTVLAEIEEGALRTLRLRAGIGAAEAALRLYRERHRSQMMARASEAFRTISRGAYTGLTSQADKDGERLIALVAGGGSKAAAELSKGTRFQLYLALRVAGYHEFAAVRRPVPFIADDIMESFDDFRAEEAFRLFAGMAEVGQVIYLTHHQHLIPIAEAVCPGVRVHRLDAD